MNGSTWLLLVHFFAAGFQMYINQEAARRRCDRMLYVFVVAATTCLLLLAPLLLWASGQPFLRGEVDLHKLSIYAAYALFFVVLGGAYAMVTYARLRAQRVLPTYVFNPLSRASLLIVILVSILYLGEQHSGLEMIAIALAFVPLLLFSREGASDGVATMKMYGIAWTLLSAVGSAGLQVASKVLVDPDFGIHMHVLVLVFGVNSGNLIVAAITRATVPGPFRELKSTLQLGFCGGVVNVFSFMSLAVYLVDGDASTIYPISSLSMVVPIAIMMALKREKPPSPTQWFAFFLALFAVIVLVRG